VLLAVDVGNTQTALGLYAGEVLRDHWRLATERSSTADELGVLLGGLLEFDDVNGICLSSTVPVLVREWEELAEKWAHASLLVMGPGVKTGIAIGQRFGGCIAHGWALYRTARRLKRAWPELSCGDETLREF